MQQSQCHIFLTSALEKEDAEKNRQIHRYFCTAYHCFLFCTPSPYIKLSLKVLAFSTDLSATIVTYGFDLETLFQCKYCIEYSIRCKHFQAVPYSVSDN